MRFAKTILLATGMLLLGLPGARAGLLMTNLISLRNTNGASPCAGLIQAADGNFYGTTYYGGAGGNPGFGTVFRITTGGGFSNLFLFNGSNGAYPYGGLVQGTNGGLYGTTEQGGTNGGFGTVFEINPAGGFLPLFSFNNTNGAYPEAGLALGTDGNFYGTTSQGGTNGGFGTVFRITHSGGFSNLFSFNGTNGEYPYATLLQGTNGLLYGTTLDGGTNGGNGTVFEVTSAGALTVLCSLDYTNGAKPYAGLTPGAGGNFYGTASAGGASNNGTIFIVSPAGALASAFSFGGSNGAAPYGSLVRGVDGNFYGTTSQGGTNGGHGTVFKWSAANSFTSLVSFDYFSNGAFPLAGLAPGTDGDFYGTAYAGAAGSAGSIFRLSVPMPPGFLSITPSGATVNFVWNAVAWQTYQAQSISNLTLTNWANLGAPVTATNGRMTFSDPLLPGPSRQFYRVILLP